MHSTNEISVFIKQNDIELRRMVSHLCRDLNYAEPTDDVVQDIYFKFLDDGIIAKFNPYYNSGEGDTPVKMSTYIFRIIRNFILSRIKSLNYKTNTHKITKYDHNQKDTIDIDKILQENTMAIDYENMLTTNHSSDSMEGLGADVRDFSGSVLKSQKKSFKRKTLCSGSTECSLDDIFQLLYEGYTNKEIAKMYNVSDMTISNLKNKLTNKMVRYGFKTRKYNDSVKMPQMQGIA